MTAHHDAFLHEQSSLVSILTTPETRLVWSYLKDRLSPILYVFLLTLVSSGGELIRMALILALIGTKIPFAINNIPLWLLALSVLLLSIFLAFIDYIRKHLSYEIQKNFIESLRKDVLLSLLNRPMSFFTSQKGGEASYLLNGQVGRFSGLVPLFTDSVAAILQGAAVLVLCLLLSVKYTAIVFLLVVVIWSIVRIVQKRIRKLSVIVSDLSSKACSKVEESVYAIKLIKIYKKEQEEVRRNKLITDELAEKQVKLSDLRNIAGSVAGLGFLVILVSLAYLTNDPTFLAAYAVMILRLFPCVNKLIEARTGFATMYGHMVAVRVFLENKHV